MNDDLRSFDWSRSAAHLNDRELAANPAELRKLIIGFRCALDAINLSETLGLDNPEMVASMQQQRQARGFRLVNILAYITAGQGAAAVIPWLDELSAFPGNRHLHHDVMQITDTLTSTDEVIHDWRLMYRIRYVMDDIKFALQSARRPPIVR